MPPSGPVQVEIGPEYRPSRVVIEHDDHAYALVNMRAEPAELKLIDTTLAEHGFELMPEDECPGEVTYSGLTKFWAVKVGG